MQVLLYFVLVVDLNWHSFLYVIIRNFSFLFLGLYILSNSTLSEENNK